MKTAVEFIIEQLENANVISRFAFPEVIQQAKAMEKEQIIDAYENGLYDGDGRNRSHYNMNAEQYYNQTFKSE